MPRGPAMPSAPPFTSLDPGRVKMNDFTETAGLRDYPLARRGMMMTSLISGFTLAVDRGGAQTITAGTNGLVVGDTKIPTSDGDLPAYYAHPAKGTKFPV